MDRAELDAKIEAVGAEMRRLNAETSFEEITSPEYEGKVEALMARLQSLCEERDKLFPEPLTRHSRWKGKIY